MKINKCSVTNNKSGFTLIELLIVLTIVGILFVVVFVSLNPTRLFAQSRNAQRWIHVSQIIDAIHLYSVQNNGVLPNETFWVDKTTYAIGTSASGCSSGCPITSTQNTCLDMTELVTDQRLSQVPIDPSGGTSTMTGFYVYRNGGVVTVGSCFPELNEEIVHSR